MSQAMTDRKIRKNEENREDNSDIQNEISSDGTSSQSHEQTPVQATPAAASPHNENTGVNEITPEIDLDRSKLDLYNAAVFCEWDKARSIFEKYPDLVSTPLNASGETALHVAVREDIIGNFVVELVNRMTPRDLEIRDAEGKTAFHMAVLERYYFTKIMIQKNQNLAVIPGPGGMLPVHLAASSGHHKIVEELCSQNLLERMDDKDIERLLFLTISSSMYDMAKKLLLYDEREFSIARDDQGLTALHILARKHPKEFATTNLRGPSLLLRTLCNQVGELEYNQIEELITKPSVVLFDAVKSGNVTVVRHLLEMNRELMKIKDPNNGRSLLHYAVLHRQRDIFNYILEMETVNLIIRDVDNDGNNVLHFTALLPEETSSSSSPNFQMLEKVVWLKAYLEL